MLFYAFKKFAPWFDGDGAGGGGGNPPQPPSNDTNPPDGKGKEPANQEDLNKQFAERAQRAAESERKKLWETLGITSQEQLDAFVKAKKENEDKNRTELEKLANQKKAAEDQLAAKDSSIEALSKRIVDSEIKFAATSAVKDKDGKVTRAAFRPEAMDEVLLLVERSEIKEEDGKYQGIEKALEKLAKAKPYLLAESNKQAAPKGTPSADKSRQPGGAPEQRTPIISSL